MKKIIAVSAMAVFALSFASCKKDYTCTCTLNGQSYSTELKDVKKSDAKTACDTWGVIYSSAGGSCSLN